MPFVDTTSGKLYYSGEVKKEVTGSVYREAVQAPLPYTSGVSLYTLFLDTAYGAAGLLPDGKLQYNVAGSALFNQIDGTQKALYTAIQENYVKVEKSNAISTIMTSMQNFLSSGSDKVLYSNWLGNVVDLTGERIYKFFFTDSELVSIRNNTKKSSLYDVIKKAVTTPGVVNYEAQLKAALDYLGLDNFLGKKRADAIDQIQTVASTLFAQNQSDLAEINKYNLEYGNLYNFIGQLAEAIRRMHDAMLNLR